jgi:hypothetical protein
MVRNLHTLGALSLCLMSLTFVACDDGPTSPGDDDTVVPFGGYMILDGDSSDYIEIPHSAALSPTGAMTLEGWVKFESVDCPSVIGKGYQSGYWVGFCDDLRSYFRGSAEDAGTAPLNVWTHWAVTVDGAVRRHYINGQLADDFAEAGALTTNTSPLRIGSDVSWEVAPFASLDEIRLWNVVRTQAQIQSTMNRAIKTAMSGLVAVWPLDTNGMAAVGSHHGAVVGSPVFTQ